MASPYQYSWSSRDGHKLFVDMFEHIQFFLTPFFHCMIEATYHNQSVIDELPFEGRVLRKFLTETKLGDKALLEESN